MSNFSFSHSFFQRPVLQTHENQGLIVRERDKLDHLSKTFSYANQFWFPDLKIFKI